MVHVKWVLTQMDLSNQLCPVQEQGGHQEKGLLCPPVPVGEGHHDVEGSEEEVEVEEAVVVGHPILLVVIGTMLPVLRGLTARPGRALLCQHQLVHLAVVRGADAAGTGGSWMLSSDPRSSITYSPRASLCPAALGRQRGDAVPRGTSQVLT